MGGGAGGLEEKEQNEKKKEKKKKYKVIKFIKFLFDALDAVGHNICIILSCSFINEQSKTKDAGFINISVLFQYGNIIRKKILIAHS